MVGYYQTLFQVALFGLVVQDAADQHQNYVVGFRWEQPDGPLHCYELLDVERDEMGDSDMGWVQEVSEETGPEGVGIGGMLQIEGVSDFG